MEEEENKKRVRPDEEDDEEEEDEECEDEEYSNPIPGQPHVKMPKKSKYRMRAHINPLNRITYPVPFSPDHANWKLHYPLFYGGDNCQNSLIYTNSANFTSY